MAKNQIDISTNKRLQLNEDSVNSGTIDRKFGRPEDFIELHIYSQQNQLLISDYNFTQYKFPEGNTENLVSELNMDPVKVLRTKGYTTGKYKLVFNIQRSKIFNTFNPPFSVKEISPTRRELKAITPKLTNEQLDPEASRFIREIDAAAYLKDFVLNFNDDINIVGVNLALNKNTNKHEVLFKLIDPLPSNINLSDNFRVVEEITDPIILNVDLGLEINEDEGIPLQGPNFKIDVRLNNSVPSSFKNFDEVLNYSLTSSYHNLLNHLENREIPDISYDFLRTVSGSNEGDPIEEVYHFENFTHFSSAVERLKNFEYKIKLIELYDSQTLEINSITGPTSASVYTLENKEAINIKKQNLIKGFDGYERFLYYTSGTFAWPKQDPGISPYTLYPITSSEVKTWLGSEIDTSPNYGGQLLSASLFDRQNENALTRLVPNHIMDNPDNSFYSSFVNMVGQHFDQIWVHIKHLTEVNDAHHSRGISKELVYFSLKSLGLETFDQFENSNLIEYILGEGTSGSVFYDTPQSQSLVTASMGSVPKSDITKNIWKRLYHNAPYLLKTKGTERGLRALMSCYGIPSTILNVKEYGGSTSDKTTYKTFTNDKGGLALKGDSGEGGFFIKTNWSSSLTDALSSSAKTIEFRIKPHRVGNERQHLWSLANNIPGEHVPQLEIVPYQLADISSSGDATQYGYLRGYFKGDFITYQKTSDPFPIYNGEFWNIFVGVDVNDSANPVMKFGAYQANHLKNINSYVTSIYGPTIDEFKTRWGLLSGSDVTSISGDKFCYIGGREDFTTTNEITQYSGSLQEVRYYFGELLSHETLKKHALEPFMYAGNTISSSYENLVLRLPLGSNDKRDSSSFHPNPNIDYLNSQYGDNLINNNIWQVNSNLDSENTINDYDPGDANITAPSTGFRFQTQDVSSPDINLKNNGIFTGITNDAVRITYTITDSNNSSGLAIYNTIDGVGDQITLDTTVGTHELIYVISNKGIDNFILKRNANSIDITIKDIVITRNPDIFSTYTPFNTEIRTHIPSDFKQSNSDNITTDIPSTSYQSENLYKLLDNRVAEVVTFTGTYVDDLVDTHITFDLGSILSYNPVITNVNINFGPNSNFYHEQVEVLGSNDNVTFTRIAIEESGQNANPRDISFPANTTQYKYYRLFFNDQFTHYQNMFLGLREIEFSGETTLTIFSDPLPKMTNESWEEVVEEHYTPTPDTVGISTTSEKTRIDIGTIDDDWLSPTRKTETSTLDNQPPDYEDLGVFFSPTNELNEDIIYTLGAFRLDDYIGSPLPDQQKASTYKDLSTIKDIYFKKVERRYNYWDYIKLIQYIDHTLFKLVEQWVPMKANLKTGLLIEPHYLERTKFARELPVIDDGQTMVNGSYNTINSEIEPNRSFNLDDSSVIVTNNLSDTTDNKGQRLEQGTNTTINLNDYIVEIAREASQAPVGRTSSTLLGNATKGRLSRRYYRKLDDSGKETIY